MSEKVEIIICLGSSCFSRGNKYTVKAIDDWLKEKRLKDRVNFHGAHCFSQCVNGPVLKIADKIYEHIDKEKAIKILTEYFDV
ncbi:MAG TPA: electron transport complex protein RnfG [Bacteroidales bacterium]|jgi:NADH:ubiquinone oxidoreductase subunit E|nr:electron transport complex protein RnfG [Bacteroidales bacterium]HAW58864.1 electron transport complex protein RnfG [Bacteroidales bacterium]HQN97913.1 (2Fe-2S) ferredoxin domain-containing protein [Bacteroidales bacterium]HQQ02730.1 (2Fe-2S) ferredoxin domain-containing protein [Bacteroidales bacterium]